MKAYSPPMPREQRINVLYNIARERLEPGQSIPLLVPDQDTNYREHQATFQGKSYDGSGGIAFKTEDGRLITTTYFEFTNGDLKVCIPLPEHCKVRILTSRPMPPAPLHQPITADIKVGTTRRGMFKK